jgi:hypothetical protein
VLRQGKVRRGNSCLDVGIARCDGERRAQMEDDTLQEEGSLLSRQQGVRPCHLQALRRGQKLIERPDTPKPARQISSGLTIDPPGCQPAPQRETAHTGT